MWRKIYNHKQKITMWRKNEEKIDKGEKKLTVWRKICRAKRENYSDKQKIDNVKKNLQGEEKNYSDKQKIIRRKFAGRSKKFHCVKKMEE
jgi:hypothetical protein